jgi:ankyrin repeat protein
MSIHTQADRHLPVRPDLDQLKRQAKELLSDVRAGRREAVEEFTRLHPKPPKPADAKLADAQLALARAYQAASWPRLVQACRLVGAIWEDDIETVRRLVTRYPNLLVEEALIRKNSNWGPPMTYAANVGRDRIIEMLYEMGARDLMSALDRAALQGRIETGKLLHRLAGSPTPPDDALGGPAYTLSAAGTKYLFEIGARVYDEKGIRLAPVDVVLETDSRKPDAKHAILEMYVQNGLELPDTPVMALHRGRIDLLERHLRHDPHLLRRTFSHEEIYPPELGCHDEVNATQGTPLKGTTLLHLCIDYDELQIARWLIEKGADVDAKADVDEDGFGGHTPLFGTVVSQPNFWMNYTGGWAHSRKPSEAPFARLLLDNGADPNARASLRKKLHPGYGPKYDVENTYEYKDISPLGWGEQFHAKVFVSEPAMELIAARGGHA